MPNSKIYEKPTVLPSGGSQVPFLSPTGTQTLTDAMKQQSEMRFQVDMQPNLGNKSNVNPQGNPSMLQQPQRRNLFTERKLQMPSPSPVQQEEPKPTYTYMGGDETQNVLDYLTRPSNEEQQLSKQNESKKKLLLLADALRHIGNLYYTTKGATPQQFTSPVAQQEGIYQTELQRRQKERAFAVEQALAQAKQEADAAYKQTMLGQKQAEIERKNAYDQLKLQMQMNQQDALKAYREGQLQLGRDNLQARKEQNAALNKLAKQRIDLGYARLDNQKNNKKKTELKDLMPMRHFQKDKTAYISKKWANSPEGRAEISSMYNWLLGQKKQYGESLINPVMSNGLEKENPTVMEMLTAMQDASWTKPYMDWINEYGYDPNGVAYHGTPTHDVRQAQEDRRTNAVNKSKGFKL